MRLKFDIKVNVEVSVGVNVDADVCHSVGVDWATKVKACNIFTTKEYT